MKKKEKAKRQKPRLPEEGRERIHQGGAHSDKKKYRREKDCQHVRDCNPGVFLFSFHTFFVGGFFIVVYNRIKFEICTSTTYN
jgi:hypothetical protein